MNTLASLAIAVLLVCLARSFVLVHSLATPTLLMNVQAVGSDAAPREGREDSEDVEGCGPPDIILGLSGDHVTVAEEGRSTVRIDGAPALHDALRVLKDKRPERVRSVLFVDDDVAHHQLVAVLDTLYGLDLREPSIWVEPPAAEPGARP
jgi:hypothetical protein